VTKERNTGYFPVKWSSYLFPLQRKQLAREQRTENGKENREQKRENKKQRKSEFDSFLFLLFLFVYFLGGDSVVC